MVADLHAIGATMEDVGKNVMANMSGTPSSSSICAKAVAGEGKTLTEVRCFPIALLLFLCCVACIIFHVASSSTCLELLFRFDSFSTLSDSDL